MFQPQQIPPPRYHAAGYLLYPPFNPTFPSVHPLSASLSSRESSFISYLEIFCIGCRNKLPKSPSVHKICVKSTKSGENISPPPPQYHSRNMVTTAGFSVCGCVFHILTLIYFKSHLNYTLDSHQFTNIMSIQSLELACSHIFVL